MSNNLTEFVRGDYIARGNFLTNPEVPNDVKRLFNNVSKKSGKSPTRKKLRDLLALTQKKSPKMGIEIGNIKLSEKLDALIEFNMPLKGVKPGSIGKSPLGLAVRKNQITKKLKRKKSMQGSIPGDGGGCAMLSSRLDELLFGDPRPRNNLGEFSPQQEGVADPNSMAKTYFHPAAKKAAGYGGAAIAGGALGALGAGLGKDAYSAVKNLLAKKKLK